MADKQGRMAKAVEEIIDLPVVKNAIMKMIRSSDPNEVDKALKNIAPLIAALCRANPSPKVDGAAPALDESDLAE